MKTSSTNPARALREATLGVLWRQWSALGVAGQAGCTGEAMVDPEALLLVSTVFARHDARLFDEMLDWLGTNGAWINVQRLTRLQRDFRLGESTLLAAIAEYLAAGSAHHKWNGLRKVAVPPGQRRPLFPHLPVPKSPDVIFQRWGWLRPIVERRRLSELPRKHQPATFLLQLRALFGRQSRAEVLAWLLSHEAGHPAQIARETGYIRGAIQTVLNELALSGHVRIVRHGREKQFSAACDHWRFLLTWNPDGGFPRWRPWAGLFTLIRALDEVIGAPAFATHSEAVRAIELNRVTNAPSARLAQSGYPLAPPTGTADQWVAEVCAKLAAFER